MRIPVSLNCQKQTGKIYTVTHCIALSCRYICVGTNPAVHVDTHDSGETMIIKNNCRVTVDYIMKDKAGRVIESSESQGSLEYVHGTQEIPAGLEQALDGSEPGNRLHVTVPPEKAYGKRKPSLVKSVTERAFRGFEKPRVGMRFKAIFDGVERFCVVTGKDGRMVTVDGNHPLAGKTLVFDLEVKKVRLDMPDAVS
jgi:FKBP-type peptidyl-prolyl cis-trans isomerase SlyD